MRLMRLLLDRAAQRPSTVQHPDKLLRRFTNGLPVYHRKTLPFPASPPSPELDGSARRRRGSKRKSPSSNHRLRDSARSSGLTSLGADLRRVGPNDVGSHRIVVSIVARMVLAG